MAGRRDGDVLRIVDSAKGMGTCVGTAMDGLMLQQGEEAGASAGDGHCEAGKRTGGRARAAGTAMDGLMLQHGESVEVRADATAQPGVWPSNGGQGRAATGTGRAAAHGSGRSVGRVRKRKQRLYSIYIKRRGREQS